MLLESTISTATPLSTSPTSDQSPTIFTNKAPHPTTRLLITEIELRHYRALRQHGI